METLKPKLKKFLCERLKEASTWQGLGALIVILGGRWAIDLPWGELAALGAIVSGLIKMVFPDKVEGKGEAE